ncbi:flagellar hook-length control protein FliK [Agrobacterium rosae]|uniref:Flagellar hook-length control protein FliK n=1 Tax=Agrobacterium rosae TaxID=1972867 RepID=A0A1R3TM84_9HYPH|nr:flagellar hook-length control protein FliK [Agrobacterium rosae]SCX16185.1 Flagellar hook-length control protein FliK [Agrobacterium rosae]
MNVLKTIPGNAEIVSQASRQDRDSSSKRGGSGFSDTLDKAAPSKQAPASKSANSNVDAAQSATAAQPDTAETPVTAVPTAAVNKTITTPGIFLEATNATVAPPTTQTAIPVPFDGLQNAKTVQAGPVAVAPLLEATDETVPLPVMSDLAKLVTALSKASASSAPSEVDGTVETGDDVDDVDVALPEASSQNNDLLTLLASTVMPIEQTTQQNAPPARGDGNSALGTVSGAALGGKPIDESATTSSTVVRLQKQDASALDLHFDTSEDGSTKVDVSKASGDVADVVQVVESRRFVGLAPTSNAASITTAMATDPEWATAMSGQTSNSPMISSTGQVVHVLKIQMTPVDLGHVTAAMKLVGDELSVQLTAHTLKGYSELQKDSSGILDALKSQGFTVEQVTVTLASGADRQDSGTNNRQSADTGQQGAQQGQRGHEEKQQEQFYRQPGSNAREETISHESVSSPEVPARVASARPDHVYL